MTVERALRIIAGCMILLSLTLAFCVNRWFLLLTGFVGLNLFQYGFSNWCPAVWILEKSGVPHGPCQADGHFHRVKPA